MNEFGAGFHAEVVHHAVLVGFDGAGGDLQNAADFLGGFAFGEQLEHLALATGEGERFAEVVAGVVEQLFNGGGAELGRDVEPAGEGGADGDDQLVGSGVLERFPDLHFALVEFNAELRKALKKEGLLTSDSRVKERKKYGLAGARKRFQFSKR